MILGGLGLTICVANMANVSDVINQEKKNVPGTHRRRRWNAFGAGLLILLVGCIVVIVASVLAIVASRARRVPSPAGWSMSS